MKNTQIKQINDKARVIQRAVRSFLFRKKIRSLGINFIEFIVIKNYNLNIKQKMDKN